MIRFIIVNTNEIDSEMERLSLQTNKNTARKNADGTKTLLKFSTKSSPAKLKFSQYKKYTRSEIETIMQSPDWKEEVEN